MNLKLRSMLYLLLISALVIDGAIAQQSGADDIRAKLASDYNAAKWRAVIADAAMLQKLHAMDLQLGIVTAQAYYKAADYAGCVKYIQEYLDPLSNRTAALLLERCQKS